MITTIAAAMSSQCFLVSFIAGGTFFGTLFWMLGYVRGHHAGYHDALEDSLDIDRHYPGRGMIDP
jgi:hypothetical protein